MSAHARLSLIGAGKILRTRNTMKYALHLERLINYVNGGSSLDSHDDVPSDIRRDLVLESQTRRKSKKTDMLTTGPPYPPTISNVLPAQNGATPAVTSSVRRHPSDDHLVIPRSREAVLDNTTNG